MRYLQIIKPVLASSLFFLGLSMAQGQTAVGYYDENMVFHYGSPPATSYYDSGSSGSTNSGGGYYDWGGWDPYQAADDFVRDWNRRQAEQKAERERRKAERERKLKEARDNRKKQGGETLFQPRSKPEANSKPNFNLFGLNRVGNDWEPRVNDLKPRAVASQIRSGDNYVLKEDYDKAIRSYRAALRVDPRDETARKKLEEAKEAKKKKAQSKPSSGGLKQLFKKQ